MSESGLSLHHLARVLRDGGLEVSLRGAGSVTVRGASHDSRNIVAGDLFLAWNGSVHDGHDFVGDAWDAGARAALVERFLDLDLPQLQVDDARRGAALAARELILGPARGLRVAAVTGTNGKTTTTLLLREILAAREPAAALGTLGLVGPDGAVRSGTAGLTTPGPVEIVRRLAGLVEEGVSAVALEASSHALAQRRLDGIRVHAAVFTNLTQDHLDYHGTQDAYRAAKARLLSLVTEEGGVVVHAGDPAWAGLPEVSSRLLATGLEGEERGGVPRVAGSRLPDLLARDIELTGEGSRFRAEWGEERVGIALPLLGRFNVENALGALGAALLFGSTLGEAAEALRAAPVATGRLEVTAREPVPVILDYAHTPHALERVLETLRPLYSGRLIVVFGAGGDRDREKRPAMGRVAARGADLAIVTSDNPRTEDPDAIVDDIVRGMGGGVYERIPDRREAIARALRLARPGDAILLAGKGHETYQEVGAERREFDERKVVREILDSGRAA